MTIEERVAAGRDRMDEVLDDFFSGEPDERARIRAAIWKALDEVMVDYGLVVTAAERDAIGAAVRTTDKHPNALVVADILHSLGPHRRLRGLWVHVHGDGTQRAREREVVVAIQYDNGSEVSARALEGRGTTMRSASEAIAAVLGEKP